MGSTAPGGPRVLDVTAAAEILHLTTEGVEALVGAGYLQPAEAGPSGPRFALGDLKAFLARNQSDGDGDADGVVIDDPESVDPDALLAALDGRAPEMARRTLDIFTQVFPEAALWPLPEQVAFIEQAQARFEAILTVTGAEDDFDGALEDDLLRIGGSAARSGAPLPQLLVILRISRDLVVQTAVEVAEEEGRHWGLALTLVLTRVLPAIDRLTDALAEGYWAAVVEREEEERERFENVVSRSSNGVYEVDLDGRVTYVNQAMALITGHWPEEMIGERLADLLVAVDGHRVEFLLNERASMSEAVEMEIQRRDGVHRMVEVRTIGRWSQGELVGFQGVVRDITAAHDLESAKNEFIEMVTDEIRQPLTTILGLGVTLGAYASELPPSRVTRIGHTIHLQAERLTRLTDDLHDVSQLESSALSVTPRPLSLHQPVEAALATVRDANVIMVDVPHDVRVLADSRRLEQVVANLVENAVEHGKPPVLVVAESRGDEVWLRVEDHGPGVPAVIRDSVFNTLLTHGRGRPDSLGLGLRLVRGLVEAMGGRAWYETADHGGAVFRLALPAPPAL